jgi:hypothetical protein
MKKSIIAVLGLLVMTSVAFAFAPSVYNSTEASSKDVSDTYKACTGSSPNLQLKLDCACKADYLGLLSHAALTPTVVSTCSSFAAALATSNPGVYVYTVQTPYTNSSHNAISIDKLYTDWLNTWNNAYPTKPLANRQAAASCVGDGFRASQNQFVFIRNCSVSNGLATN